MNRRNVLIGSGGVIALAAGATWFGAVEMERAEDYARATSAMRNGLTAQPDTSEFIRYATLAANGHNSQPWRFAVKPGSITILPDFTRRTPVVDPDDHHLFVSLGCAAENLALATAARGHLGEPIFDSAGGGSIALALNRGSAKNSALFDAIPKRQSTRAVYDGRRVGASDLNHLARAAEEPGVDLVLLTDQGRIEQLSDLVVAGNSAQMADPAFVRELKEWLRFNPRNAMRTGDGLYSVASGNPALPDWLGPVAFDWFSTTKSQNAAYARQIRSSAGVAVFAGAREDRAHWVAVGRACQRFALQATALGLKHAFINQPVEVAGLRPDLAALVDLEGRRPDIVMRFGYGPTRPWSPRRPPSVVMET